eukprot:1157623-Pelagomonas_calceolata.AAC.2
MSRAAESTAARGTRQERQALPQPGREKIPVTQGRCFPREQAPSFQVRAGTLSGARANSQKVTMGERD